MTFDELLVQIQELLQREQRLSYRALKVRFHLDDDHLEALKDELIYAKRLAADEDGRVLVWVGAADTAGTSVRRPASPATPDQDWAPHAYTPPHLAEKILTARQNLEGERKLVTVLFADIKDSTELIRSPDPEAAQQLLDPVLHRMMDAVHRFEGTVNQVLGDGIMALFGAPIAHEDHALHARESLIRHGFQEPFDTVDAIIEQATHVTTQVDGAIVYIQRAGRRGRSYHMVIEGADGIVTGMCHLTRHELNNLGRNYGFAPHP